MLSRLYGWYGKRTVHSVLAGIVLLILLGLFLGGAGSKTGLEQAPRDRVKSVTVARVADLRSNDSFRVIGTVEAVNEANLKAETSGRVTNVAVKLGDQVSAGTIIASIENSAERAALLQAEGAYEATLAQSAQSDAGLSESEVGLKNASRDAFTTSEGALINLIDELFSDPDSSIAGFRLDSKGRGAELNDQRLALKSTLREWQSDIANNFEDVAPETIADEAEERTTRINDYVTSIAQIVADQDPTNTFPTETLASYKARFESTRAALNADLSSISVARRGYEQAQLAATGGTSSLSDAQKKSALGTLRAAQANYEKTVVRTPITGTVNTLYLKAGEYVNQGAPAAIIANNSSLEIKTSVSEEDSGILQIGNRVRIEGKENGTIVGIAPAVDPLTGKVEVRIAVDDSLKAKNGTTVGISFNTNANTDENAPLTIPIASLKILPSGSVVFSVSADSKLVAHQVTLGEVRGSMVVVREGLTSDMVIVTDARGLGEGEVVEVTN